MRIQSPYIKKRARIEIVPLIDIMFFLLATFMMVSLSMIKNQGISVNLPKASSSEPQERENQVTISVDAIGNIFWNKEPVDDLHLALRLDQVTTDSKVFINGDGKADFENVIKVLDLTRKAGITKVAIETETAREMQ